MAPQGNTDTPLFVDPLRWDKEALTCNCSHLQQKATRLEATLSEETRLRSECELQLSQTRAQLEALTDRCHHLTGFLEWLTQSRTGRVLRIKKRLESAGTTLPPSSWPPWPERASAAQPEHSAAPCRSIPLWGEDVL